MVPRRRWCATGAPSRSSARPTRLEANKALDQETQGQERAGLRARGSREDAGGDGGDGGRGSRGHGRRGRGTGWRRVVQGSTLAPKARNTETLNLKTINPKTLNPQTLNPLRPQSLRPLDPKPQTPNPKPGWRRRSGAPSRCCRGTTRSSPLHSTALPALTDAHTFAIVCFKCLHVATFCNML